jgi:UDP-N-acetyl-D-mannosaminuronate dehydrogenase
MKAAVVALGKIGLPLAVQFAKSGVRTYGADIAAEAVSKITQGIPPFPGEAHLEEYLNEVLAKGMLSVGTDTVEAVSQAGIVVVVVPLLVDGDGVPSFGAMDAATRDIALGYGPARWWCTRRHCPLVRPGIGSNQCWPSFRGWTPLNSWCPFT